MNASGEAVKGLVKSRMLMSNVNLYLSSFPGERFVCKVENAKKCIEEALDSL